MDDASAGMIDALEKSAGMIAAQEKANEQRGNLPPPDQKQTDNTAVIWALLGAAAATCLSLACVAAIVLSTD
jgi:hypothetical protein